MDKALLELNTVKLLQDDLLSNVQFGHSDAFPHALANICQLTGSQSALIFSLVDDLANDEIRLTLHAQFELGMRRFRFIIKNDVRESLLLNRLFIETDQNNKTGDCKDLITALAQCEKFLTYDENCHGNNEFKDSLLRIKSAQNHACNFFNTNERTNGWLCLYSKSPINDLISTYPVLHNTLTLSLVTTARIIDQKNRLKTFQQVINLMPQRVFWKNRRSIYLGANQAFANDASLNSPEELVGVTDYDIFPEQAELFRSDDAHTMNTQVHLINSEEPQKHADGKTIWLRTSKRPVTNADNKVVGMVGTYDEITDLKNAQEALQESKNELERRVKERTEELNSALLELEKTRDQMVESEKMAALGGLVSGVAHEINTPIGIGITSASHLEDNIRKMTTDMAQGKLTKASFSEGCSQLSQSCELIIESLNKASKQIVNFKRVAVDQSTDSQRIVNFNEYIDAIIGTIVSAYKNIDINLDLVINKNISAFIYPGALSQIITNLTENTIIHGFEGREKGTISIKCTEYNQAIHLDFTDDGSGIDKSEIDKIFDPFFTTKRGTGRSGLGMNIIYNLVTQKLKGRIRCESTVGGGTSFFIEIPIE